MEKFTGWQYLLIDVANNYGLDKKLFHERIQWAEENLLNLESLIDQVKPKNKPLYFKSCMAIRRAQRGEPIGHTVAFDAVCSGLQVMSVLTGCKVGAGHTGLIAPNVRSDAYTDLTDCMNNELDGTCEVPREEAKEALMTSLYGSQAKPKEIFGRNTPELSAFYVAAETIAPGAWNLLQELKAAWQADALVHTWTLPDGFQARVRVKVKKQVRIQIDEL